MRLEIDFDWVAMDGDGQSSKRVSSFPEPWAGGRMCILVYGIRAERTGNGASNAAPDNTRPPLASSVIPSGIMTRKFVIPSYRILFQLRQFRLRRTPPRFPPQRGPPGPISISSQALKLTHENDHQHASPLHVPSPTLSPRQPLTTFFISFKPHPRADDSPIRHGPLIRSDTYTQSPPIVNPAVAYGVP